MWQRGTRKVTPYAGWHRPAWDWRRGWLHPKRQRAEQRERDLARWKRWSGASTIGQAKTGIGWITAGLSTYSFRLLDKHGREYGPRYTVTGNIKLADGSRIEKILCEAVDAHGRQIWVKRGTRCRIVDRQPEDPHSAACRALKRAHRLGMTE